MIEGLTEVLETLKKREEERDELLAQLLELVESLEGGAATVA